MPQRGEARADVVDGQAHALGAQRSRAPRAARRSPRPGRARTARAAPGRRGSRPSRSGQPGVQQRLPARRSSRRTRRPRSRCVGCPLEREQLEAVPEADRCAPARTRRPAPCPTRRGTGSAPRRRPARPSGGRRSAGGRTTGPPAVDAPAASRSSISSRRSRSTTPGSMITAAAAGEHLHQRLVALGEALVRGEPGRAEGAVEGAVAERHGDRDVAADPRQPRRGQRHRVGELGGRRG